MGFGPVVKQQRTAGISNFFFKTKMPAKIESDWCIHKYWNDLTTVPFLWNISPALEMRRSQGRHSFRHRQLSRSGCRDVGSLSLPSSSSAFALQRSQNVAFQHLGSL